MSFLGFEIVLVLKHSVCNGGNEPNGLGHFSVGFEKPTGITTPYTRVRTDAFPGQTGVKKSDFAHRQGSDPDSFSVDPVSVPNTPSATREVNRTVIQGRHFSTTGPTPPLAPIGGR